MIERFEVEVPYSTLPDLKNGLHRKTIIPTQEVRALLETRPLPFNRVRYSSDEFFVEYEFEGVNWLNDKAEILMGDRSLVNLKK